MSTIQDTLANAGFEPSVAKIYTILIENNELSVGEIIKRSELSRAGAYDALNLLLAQGYVEYRKDGRNAFYKALHPNKLFALVEQKKRDNALFEQEMNETIRSLTGSFNLANNKPGVRFFEGEEGMLSALEDITKNFQPNTELLSFVKVLPPTEEKKLDNAFSNFIKKRIATNVKTLVLAIDSPEAQDLKQNDKNALRETRLVPAKNLFLDFPGGEIFIYGNEICTVTIAKDNYFAFTVSNPTISQMLKTFFLSEWNLLAEKIMPPAVNAQPPADGQPH